MFKARSFEQLPEKQQNVVFRSIVVIWNTSHQSSVFSHELTQWNSEKKYLTGGGLGMHPSYQSKMLYVWTKRKWPPTKLGKKWIPIYKDENRSGLQTFGRSSFTLYKQHLWYFLTTWDLAVPCWTILSSEEIKSKPIYENVLPGWKQSKDGCDQHTTHNTQTQHGREMPVPAEVFCWGVYFPWAIKHELNFKGICILAFNHL